MLKIRITIFFIVVFNLALMAEVPPKVKSIVVEYPGSIKTYEKLAELINSDFDSELYKAGAIYTWIALNISYDVKNYFSGSRYHTYSYRTLEEKEFKQRKYREKVAQTTIKNRKAVCEGYTTLFKKLCELTGIECVIVDGASKTNKRDIGKNPTDSDHSWNAIRLNNSWYLVDVTWGAGSVDYDTKTFTPEFTDAYFLTPPELFALEHYPEERDWLFINMSKQEFANLPMFHTKYIESDFEMVLPKDGIITKIHDRKVKFKIKTGAALNGFSYALNNEKYLKKIKAVRKDEFVLFEVPILNRKSGYLTICYNKNAMMTYRLRIK